MLKPFAKENKTFTFRDGQEVILKEPTLLQLKSALNKKDDLDRMKSLLIDMSEGDLTNEFLDNLPVGEFNRLSNEVNGFSGFDEKNS